MAWEISGETTLVVQLENSLGPENSPERSVAAAARGEVKVVNGLLLFRTHSDYLVRLCFVPSEPVLPLPFVSRVLLPAKGFLEGVQGSTAGGRRPRSAVAEAVTGLTSQPSDRPCRRRTRRSP